MNRHDEEFFSEAVDEREDTVSRIRPFAWRPSPRYDFIYSAEKFAKADIQSLDRVWDRMREHVTSNSSAYQTNSNLANLKTGDLLPAAHKKRRDLEIQKRSTFRHRLGMAAAVCFIVLLVGSLVGVLNTFHHESSNVGAPNQTRQIASHPTAVPSFIAGKITIIQLKGTIEFQPASLSVPQGTGVLWYNQSSISQVIVRDDKPVQYLTLKAGEQLPRPFPTVGTFSYHLQANPMTHTTISVFNAIKIVSSGTGNAASLSLHGLKLKVGTSILWTNTTNQAQTLISDSTGGSVKILPKYSYTMLLDKTGVFTWHLASNPGERITIVVFT